MRIAEPEEEDSSGCEEQAANNAKAKKAVRIESFFIRVLFAKQNVS